MQSKRKFEPQTLIVFGFLSVLAFALALVLIMWLGGYPALAVVKWFGLSLLACLAMAALFGAGVLIDGPLSSVRLKIGKIEADLSGDDK